MKYGVRGGKWTTHELRKLQSHFKYYFDQEKLPKMAACRSFLETHGCKQGRTPRDVYDKLKAMILK